VLREVKTAYWTRRLSLFGWRYSLVVGKNPLGGEWTTSGWQALDAAQCAMPTQLLNGDGRDYWWFESAFYWEDEQLTADDMLALIRDRERRQRRKLERAHSALSLDGEPVRRREPIPREVRLAVFERDGGRCIECDSNFELQYDHIIPVAMGGATTVANLQLLCAPCNQAKGGTLG
jgi:5-methylcytosine-specific restriction endonuclease McrA